VQACNLRDNFSLLRKNGIEVIGVSPDTVKSHKNFEQKFQLPFPLIADEKSRIAIRYGVWGPKKFMGREYIGLHRTTFAIDEKGKLVGIIEKPKSKDHAAEILQSFGL
jgi:peroxiredoxin Q/BCP